MQNKYKDVTLGTVEAVFNKLGGMEGVESFLRGNVEITVVKHTIDLATSPRFPFEGAKVVKHEGEGVVKIELRSDDNLYIDGKKVVLDLSERQMGDKRVVGHELRQELESGELVVLNSNALDYIFDHPELYPEHWKNNGEGEPLLVFFWGSLFSGPSGGGLCVRCLCWGGGGLGRFYRWLDYGWDRLSPSASVARS